MAPSANRSWCSLGALSPILPRIRFPFFSPGINPAYRTEDANEDTIGVLVRLITEKKGEERVFLFHPMPGSGGSPPRALDSAWGKSCRALPPKLQFDGDSDPGFCISAFDLDVRDG